MFAWAEFGDPAQVSFAGVFLPEDGKDQVCIIVNACKRSAIAPRTLPSAGQHFGGASSRRD